LFSLSLLSFRQQTKEHYPADKLNLFSAENSIHKSLNDESHFFFNDFWGVSLRSSTSSLSSAVDS